MSELKYSRLEWIGNIPNSWCVKRLKYLKNIEENSFVDGDWIESEYIEDKGIRYYTTGNIGDGIFKEQGYGFISELTFKKLKCKYMYPGDLVFSRLNAPYGRSCILPDKEKKCVVAVDNVVLRTDQDKRYLCYVTQTDGYHKSVEDYSNGSTMQRISRNNLGNVSFPIPPIKEQKLIADFLDVKVGIMDSIIFDLNKQIEMLSNYKMSLIKEIVSNGLKNDVEVKDTGIEWIGKIPSEWKIKRIKDCNKLQTGTTPQDLFGIVYEKANDTYNWYAPGDYNNNNFLLSDSERMITAQAVKYNKIKLYPKNAILLVAIGATVGKIGYTNEKAYSNQQITALIPYGINYKYELYYLVSISGYIKENALYTTLPILNNQYLGGIKIVVPPIEEQNEIVEYLDKKCDEIEVILKKKINQKEKMEQYKKSVIYEYVTGKKRVEGAEELYG